MGDDASRPTIRVPPRASFESLLYGGSIPGFSPGPMTLVSSFFSDPDNCSSQLLAGAMASPATKPSNGSSFADNSCSSSSSTASDGDGAATEKDSGYKQNRPVGLVLAPSPLFMIPPGLSPSGLLNSPGFLSPLQSPFGMSHQQALAHVTAQASSSESYLQLQVDFQQFSQGDFAEPLQDDSCFAADEYSQQNKIVALLEPEIVKTELPESFQSDKKPLAAASVEKLECDGYKWRKYGQKQVKASEYPRSYYRCTHISCPVKKKVERSFDGHITEITYKGLHSHEPPQTNKRARNCLGQVAQVKPQHGSQCPTPASLAPEDGQLSRQASSSQQLPVASEHDGSEDTSVQADEDDDNDQPATKRRCTEEVGAYGHTSAHKTVTESRIIVQTRSEVDLLDDGFKWRKYGQKVVKGNPYPRSYYRCTHPGCKVRKHVERASADPKAVITTYEGRHNHQIPAAKNSGSNPSKSSTSVQLKSSQKIITRKPTSHTGMDFERLDQIPILPLVKEGEIVA